jgi:beta-glucosidase
MAGRTYRYFGGKPLFPFGHGLSYTRFTYGVPRIEPLGIVPGNTWRVRVPVTNVGGREGEEVVQLYARPLRPQSGDARRSLIGFVRLPLRKSETGEASFVVPKDRFRTWDPASKSYRVRPGTYVLEVGASSGDLRSSARLTLEPSVRGKG